MTKSEELVFYKKDFVDFRHWLQLDIDVLSWQGKYLEEFEIFWEAIFVENTSLNNVFVNLNNVLSKISAGPVVSWLNWIRIRFLIFVFIRYDITIFELARKSKTSLGKMALNLRTFFLDHYPHLENELSEVFLVSNVSCNNMYYTFSRLSTEFNISKDIDGGIEYNVTSGLEITLYPEWQNVLHEMVGKNKAKKVLNKSDFPFFSKQKYWSMFKEAVVLALVAIVVILVIRFLNNYWQYSMQNKISIYEPHFLQTEGIILRAESTDKDIKGPVTTLDSIKDLKLGVEDVEDFRSDGSFGTESEVILTSVDSLPKDFSSADSEVSDYEELQDKGSRESIYGESTVFRIMLNASNMEATKKKIDLLVNKFMASQADNVKPGTIVPGGVYYNLLVSKENIKDFVANTLEVDRSMLYESRTRGKIPPDKRKVFIWIKSI